MKMRNLFFGMLACVAFTACSSDDVDVQGGAPNIFTGDAAYMNIILSDANSGTRATTPEDKEASEGSEGSSSFEYGKAEYNEYGVNTAHFYFYNAEGVFVSEAEIWNGGDESTTDPAENIEFRGNTTVVLKGLTGKTYPKYLVTVLNKSTDFKPGNTLDEMETAIAAAGNDGNITIGVKETTGEGDDAETTTKDYFTMSTTSHAGKKDSEGNDLKYFVTEVTESNFAEEPVNLDKYANPVVVYVERLAAKVELDVAADLKETAKNVGTADAPILIYPIKVTYAGEGNDEPTMGIEKLYVKILGWKLNATAKKSYMMKNIDENWTDTGLGFTWNDGTLNHRSYWGKSWVYGKSGFPTDATYTDGESILLNYFNLEGTDASPLLKLGDHDYCAENTNTSAIVSANPRRALTSILVKAEICDADGKGLDIVRYNGMLFKQEHFLSYVLNNLNKAGELTAYYETTGEDDQKKYVQIDENDVKLENLSDGKVKVVLNTTKTLVNSNGETFSADAKTKLESDMAKASAGATGYNGGLMYYNIPIEHFNNSKNTEETDEEGVTKVTIPEAKYGVVRNHVYKVSITELANPGKGIFNPEEVIVPNDKDEKFYYVGAKINILSWKIVNQNVSL